ncbi:MAG: sodium:glutamate symporter [Phycisphaerae bacterium]|nr:sodium:glutamate symporter [Phycisphaerae bacterium]
MLSFVLLCVCLGLGHLLRTRIRGLQRLYLPSCVVGGIIGLLVMRALNNVTDPGLTGTISATNLFINDTLTQWRALPGLLINVVFACLFLGVALPRFNQIWKSSAQQLAYGQIVAWGQYVVALGLWVLFMAKFFPDLPAMFAGILPVGFEGGHGTAAGLGKVFAEHGWAAGQDLALSSATFGIVFAIIIGTGLINWAAYRGFVPHIARDHDLSGIIPQDKRPSAGTLTVHSDAIDSMSFHLVIVGLAVGLGILFKTGLVRLEASIPALASLGLFRSFPLFPLCMLGGLCIQWIEMRFDSHRLVNLGLIRRIQNTALDFLVVAAIATIRIDVVRTALVPLLILVAAGILWNVFCVTCLAPRVFKDAWFERAIAEMGQSMGVTATGLLLLRVVDPDYETRAAEAFACKQIMHEPFMGGGLWTSMAIPLIAIQGPGLVLGIACSAVFIWLISLFVMRARS